MESELNLLLNDIKSSTGIDISVYAETKKFFYSTKGKDAQIIYATKTFDGVYNDKEVDKTYFKIRFKNTNLIGIIDGATKTEYNYATLIMGLIESEANADKKMGKSDYLKALLNGDLNRTQIQKYINKFSMSGEPCFVIGVMVNGGNIESVKTFTENFMDSNDIVLVMDDSTCACIRFCENTEDYHSANEFALALNECLMEELGVKANVGVGNTVKSLTEATQSYQQAQTVLRMSTLFGDGVGVHTYKEFLLIKMLEEIPKYKLNEYLEMLLDEGAKAVFSDAEMIKTGEEFLKNDLNISETSTALYLHRNTLMYRLDKIEKATGLNIRKFADAVTFYLITILMGVIN